MLRTPKLSRPSRRSVLFRIHLGDEKFSLFGNGFHHLSDELCKGAHHGAQKSTMTHSVPLTVSLNSLSLTFLTSPICSPNLRLRRGIIGVCAFFDGRKKWQVSSNGERWHHTMDDMIIAPSVLTANLADLSTDCKEAMEAGLDWLHL